jgi:hypothetical protein
VQEVIPHVQKWEKQGLERHYHLDLERSLKRDTGLELQHVQVVVAPLLLRPLSIVYYRLLPLFVIHLYPNGTIMLLPCFSFNFPAVGHGIDPIITASSSSVSS